MPFALHVLEPTLYTLRRSYDGYLQSFRPLDIPRFQTGPLPATPTMTPEVSISIQGSHQNVRDRLDSGSQIPTLSPIQVFALAHSQLCPKLGSGLLLPSEDDDLDHLLKGGKNIYHICERPWLLKAPRHHVFENPQVY